MPRAHRTALPGWRCPSSRRPALRDCSLIVPAPGGGDVVRLLDALLAIPDAPGEVVVVDASAGGELDSSLREWIGRSRPPFALVYVASPPGLTRQRNVGIDISSRDFLFFLDPGLEPLPGYFAAACRVFDLDRDGCVGGVTGVVLEVARRGRGRDPLVYSRSGACRRDLPPFFGLRRVDVLPGWASAWRRDVFAVRRFSCFFGPWPDGEDIDLSLRAGKAWTLLACGEARLKRVSRPPRNLGYRAGIAAVRNRCFVWRRHVPEPAPRHRVRFWLGAALDAAACLGSYCARPWDPAPLCHAAGLVAGIASCFSDPPVFTEPPARREYLLATEERAAQTGN